jgi:hypothetical protein
MDDRPVHIPIQLLQLPKVHKELVSSVKPAPVAKPIDVYNIIF